MNFALVRSSFAAVLLVSSIGLADTELKLSEKDFAKYLQLRDAEALASAKKDMLPNAKTAERAAADEEFKKALQAQGMNAESWSTLRGELEMAMGALEEGRNTEDLEAEFSKQTLAVVRAHKEELKDTSYRQKAEAAAKNQASAEKRGRAPTKADLQGTWVADYGATVDGMGMPLKGADRTKMIDQMKAAGESSYTFKGDEMEARSMVPGQPPRVEKTTYRLEGNKLFYKSGKRERDLDVGMKGNNLVIQLFGVGMVFTKK